MKQIKNFFNNNGDYLIALIILISINFFLPRFMPGNPVDVILGGSEGYSEITDEMRSDLTQSLGLDKPIFMQFGIYLKDLLHFDLGYSYYYSKPVSELILSALPWTLLLVLTGMCMSVLIGYFLGIECAYRHNKKFDKVMLTFMMGLTGFTQFFVGIILLIFFGVNLGIFPVSGCRTPCSTYHGLSMFLDVLHHLALPVLTIILTEVSQVFLLIRNAGLIAMDRPFYAIAKAKGLSKKTIKHKYIGKNAMQPIVNYVGMQIGKILVGALMIEVVFSYPGLGNLICHSVYNRDYPVLEGMFFFIAVLVLLGSAVTESINRKFEKI